MMVKFQITPVFKYLGLIRKDSKLYIYVRYENGVRAFYKFHPEYYIVDELGTKFTQTQYLGINKYYRAQVTNNGVALNYQHSPNGYDTKICRCKK